MKKSVKLGLVTSRGGHLLQLHMLQPWWKKYDRFWVTNAGEDSKYLLKDERVYYGYFPEHRNVVNAIKNFFLALQIIKKEKPSLLVSMGAGIAPPFFLAGRLLGCKLLFIDSVSFVKYPSLSAKLVAPFVDKILVQHPENRTLKKSEFWGSVL